MPEELKDILRQTKGGEIPALEIYEVFFKDNLLTVAYMVKGAKDLSWERFTVMQDGNGEIYLS